jgi:hypothetical protein
MPKNIQQAKTRRHHEEMRRLPGYNPHHACESRSTKSSPIEKGPCHYGGSITSSARRELLSSATGSRSNRLIGIGASGPSGRWRHDGAGAPAGPSTEYELQGTRK